MFTYFSFLKKHLEKENKINSLILARLDRMIELLEQLLKQQQKQPEPIEQQAKSNEGKAIHVDHIHIEHLENIIFRLDNIEIDDLSGKLLIGTNIGGSGEDLVSSLVKENAKQTKKEDSGTITETSSGYKFRSNG